MKSCMLLILFSTTILLLGQKVNAQLKEPSDDFPEVVISPKAKLIDSNGNTEFLTKEDHQRFIRRPSACKIPPSLDNSELKCKLFPSQVECKQTCIFGHTFSEGIQRTMKCKYEEDRWYPSKDFESCKPFVDCNLSYGPGAYAKCYTNHMHKGPSCEVRCEHYEDKDAVPPAMYQCDIEGRWAPKLPFCVKAGSGEKLASRPRGRTVLKE